VEREPVANPVTHFFLKAGRRVRRRKEIEAAAQVTIVSALDGRRSARPIAGKTLNLSQTGALLALPEIAVDDLMLDRAAGDGISDLVEIDVHVGVGDGIGFSALGKVIWLEEVRRTATAPRHHLVGVRFVKLYKQDQENLQRVLED
jgi:hypothetical protein